MKKVLAASLMATLLAVSTALAFELPSTRQPIKGTEGPDIRRIPMPPVKGDMRDVQAFASALDGCEAVFHTAAYFRE